MPTKIDSLMETANAAHLAGRLAEAEKAASEALQANPNSVAARLLLGVIAGKTGRTDIATEHLERVLAADPRSYEALIWLSMLRRRAGELPEAEALALRAMKARPDDAYGYNNLGLCYLDQLRLTEAADAFGRAVALRADQAPTFHNLGTALYLLGRDLEATKAFDRAIMLAPRAVESYLSLGQTLLSQTDPTGAAECARRAIALSPKSASARLLLAGALIEDGQTAVAEKHLREAIDLNPQEAGAHSLLGMRLQSLGRLGEANASLRRSIELNPKQGFAYSALIHNMKVTDADRQMLDEMERLVAEGNLPPRELDFLHYGLGKARENLGEYEDAMRHFDEANRLAYQIKFGQETFDRVSYAQDFDRLIETFSKAELDRARPLGDPSDTPIVIVGMMRSGTTLAEQILSSHPQVGAAGEQRFWPHNWRGVFGRDGRGLDPQAARVTATAYLARLRLVAPGNAHVTDKMPANYEYLGPIHAALPNARIIHMRRNPVDTCISIWATPNRVPIDFAYNRENIVFAYEQYLRLMDHWRSVLPEDRFLEVNYEDLVDDREAAARRMLAHVGLVWDDALLHHEDNVRSVVTPSLWQVRQPIYRTSVDRWRRYEPWLGAFRKLLPS